MSGSIGGISVALPETISALTHYFGCYSSCEKRGKKRPIDRTGLRSSDSDHQTLIIRVWWSDSWTECRRIESELHANWMETGARSFKFSSFLALLVSHFGRFQVSCLGCLLVALISTLSSRLIISRQPDFQLRITSLVRLGVRVIGPMVSYWQTSAATMSAPCRAEQYECGNYWPIGQCESSQWTLTALKNCLEPLWTKVKARELERQRRIWIGWRRWSRRIVERMIDHGEWQLNNGWHRELKRTQDNRVCGTFFSLSPRLRVLFQFTCRIILCVLGNSSPACVRLCQISATPSARTSSVDSVIVCTLSAENPLCCYYSEPSSRWSRCFRTCNVEPTNTDRHTQNFHHLFFISFCLSLSLSLADWLITVNIVLRINSQLFELFIATSALLVRC